MLGNNTSNDDNEGGNKPVRGIGNPAVEAMERRRKQAAYMAATEAEKANAAAEAAATFASEANDETEKAIDITGALYITRIILEIDSIIEEEIANREAGTDREDVVIDILTDTAKDIVDGANTYMYNAHTAADKANQSATDAYVAADKARNAAEAAATQEAHDAAASAATAAAEAIKDAESVEMVTHEYFSQYFDVYDTEDNEEETEDNDKEDCSVLRDQILKKGVCTYGDKNYYILNRKDRSELLDRLNKTCKTESYTEVRMVMIYVLHKTILMATEQITRQIRIAHARNNQHDELTELIKHYVLLIENIVKYNMIRYVPTQRGSTCVTDYLLSFFSNANIVRGVFFRHALEKLKIIENNGGAAGGAGVAPMAATDPLSLFYFNAAMKMINILKLQSQHLIALILSLTNLYSDSVEISIPELGRAEIRKNALERYKSLPDSGMAEKLRAIVDNMSIFSTGVCFTNLIEFLETIFITDDADDFKKSIGFVTYNPVYKANAAGTITLSKDVLPEHYFSSEIEDSKQEEIRTNPELLLAIMFHVNRDAIPTKKDVHHAIGFVARDGSWYFVDDENKLMILVENKDVEQIFESIINGTLFTTQVRLPILKYYKPTNTSTFTEEPFVRDVITFHSTPEGVEEWTTHGWQEAEESEARLSEEGPAAAAALLAAPLNAGSLAGSSRGSTPVVSPANTNDEGAEGGGRRRRSKHRTYRKRKHSKTKHSKTKHSKTKHSKTKHSKTKHSKAKRRKTRHSRKN